MSTTLGCKDIEIKKSKFWQRLNSYNQQASSWMKLVKMCKEHHLTVTLNFFYIPLKLDFTVSITRVFLESLKEKFAKIKTKM